MKYKFPFLITTLLICFAMQSIRASSVAVLADDPAILYSGRIDDSNPAAPLLGYSGTRVRMAFEGESVAMLMDDLGADNTVVVFIDGERKEKLDIDGEGVAYLLASGLGNGLHTVEVVKATEGNIGNLRFKGFLLPEGGKSLPWPEKETRKIEFIGDSITAGYGIEAEGPFSGFTPSEENFLDTYAALTAKALNADYLVVARSGIGILRNYGGPHEGSEDNMPAIYDQTLFTAKEPRWDFSRFTPDVVCINLHTNDFSGAGPDEAGFVANYTAFIERIQAHYPQAKIVLLLGPMKTNPEILNLLKQVAEARNQAGADVVSVFELSNQGKYGFGAHYHPSKKQAEVNARELTAYLRERMGWDQPKTAGEKQIVAQKGSVPEPVLEPQEENWPKPLHVVGNRLHDSDGNEVWLQGVNIASLEWNPRGENIQQSFKVAIEDWGVNVIRLPVKSPYWQGKDGEAYKHLIHNLITFAANHGVYVILDLHEFRAPRPAHIDFWTEAATLYKNHPAVLFDILNEPHSTTWEVWRNGGFISEKKKQGDEDAFLTEIEKEHNARGFESNGMQGMVDVVRATGAKNIVVIGGLDWAYSLTGILDGYAIDDPDGNGVMYATHVYPWKKNWMKSFLGVAEKYPILVGEVGADSKKMTWLPANQQEDAETWVPAMLGVIQKYKLNWTAWCMHPKASPRMLLNWDYEPTPFWGKPAIEAMNGRQFEFDKLR